MAEAEAAFEEADAAFFHAQGEISEFTPRECLAQALQLAACIPARRSHQQRTAGEFDLAHLALQPPQRALSAIQEQRGDDEGDAQPEGVGGQQQHALGDIAGAGARGRGYRQIWCPARDRCRATSRLRIPCP